MRVNRREFLRTAAATAAGLPLASAVLAACRSQTRTGSPLPLPRRDRPVTWPVSGDNPPIPSGLPVERGATLRVYEWRRYLSPDVVRSFARRYAGDDVDVRVESFENRDAAVARIREPDARFDVFFPTVDQVGDLVQARLLRPLNHDYLPTLSNLWPQFRPPADPFYDRGLRYTVPYTVFATGIGWRADIVAPQDAPDVRPEPYDVFWDARYRREVGLYDSYREAIGMALIRDGIRDVNTGDSSALAAAGGALDQLVREVDVRFTTEGAYEGLPSGEFAVHQAWSGDMLSALRWGRARALGTASDLRYWWPADGTAVVGCDLLAVCAAGRNPVLAHAFLNHLLDEGVARSNFAWNGYQPPVAEAASAASIGRGASALGAIPKNLRNALMTPAEFGRGQFLLELDPASDARWLATWGRLRSGS